jgi:hypothetical protein
MSILIVGWSNLASRRAAKVFSPRVNNQYEEEVVGHRLFEGRLLVNLFE